MKLKKFADKKIKERKIILISISVIVLISISFLLYKTFASFTENIEFPIIKGQVNYFGNSDVYFAFYNGKEKLDFMPEKDNEENIVFDYGECDNGASIEWNSEMWAPLIKKLSKSKTKCSLYFKEKESIKICNKYGEESALCYITKLGDTDYNTMTYDHAISNNNLDNNLRYIGAKPNNYVSFNDELWRIIGVMKVKNENGKLEERIKIIRQTLKEGQNTFGDYSWDNKEIPNNNWTTSTLKNTLNTIYFNSESGNCYKTSQTPSICDFKNGNVKGLNNIAKSMVDTNVIWNLGVCPTSYTTTKIMYECERITDSDDNITEWTIENDPNSHNGIGLMYVSDYGYATDGGNEGKEECYEQILYGKLSEECKINNWLNNKETIQWSINSQSNKTDVVYYITPTSVDLYHKVNSQYNVEPVIYLKSNIKIEEDYSRNYGSIENPFRLTI